MSNAWKTVRIFISSTFRDMHAERDHLIKVVLTSPCPADGEGLAGCCVSMSLGSRQDLPAVATIGATDRHLWRNDFSSRASISAGARAIRTRNQDPTMIQGGPR